MLDFRMETFLTVCRCMNFTRASEELNITQPAVSQHIRFLEKHYKTKLFRYEGKRLCLTDTGELLRNASLTMLRDEQSLQNQMLHSAAGIHDLRFGVTMTVGESFMAGVLEQYIMKYPDIRLHMKMAETTELLQKLDDGEIDFAIVDGFFKKSEYDVLPYFKGDYIAISSPAYLFKKEVQNVEDLLEERLLMQEPGAGTRETLEHVLRERNLSVDAFARTAEIAGLHTLKELTKAGSGITFIYEAAVREELKSGSLRQIELQDFRVAHEFAFVWRKGSIYAEMYHELSREFSV